MSQLPRKVVVQEPYKYNDQNEGYQDAQSVAVVTVPSDVSNWNIPRAICRLS